MYTNQNHTLNLSILLAIIHTVLALVILTDTEHQMPLMADGHFKH